MVWKLFLRANWRDYYIFENCCLCWYLIHWQASICTMRAYYFGHTLITIRIPILKKKCPVKTLSVWLTATLLFHCRVVQSLRVCIVASYPPTTIITLIICTSCGLIRRLAVTCYLKENYYFRVLRMERIQAQSSEMSSSWWHVCFHAVPILLLISLWCFKWVYRLT